MPATSTATRSDEAASDDAASHSTKGHLRQWLHGLRISAKLALLVLAMMVPIIVLGTLVLRENLRHLQVARSELAGIEYLIPLHEVLRGIAVHRGLSGLAAMGEARARTQLAAQRELVDRAVQHMDTVDARHGESLGTTTSWQILKASWKRLRTETQQLTVSEGFERHTTLIAEGLELSNTLLQTSGLILDPYPVSYNIIAVTLNELPYLTEYLGRARATAVRAAHRGQASLAERTAINHYLASAREKFSEVSLGTRHALQANAAAAANANARFGQITVAMDEFQALTQQINSGTAGHTDAYEIFTAASRAIEATATFQIEALNGVRIMLENRLRHARNDLSWGTVTPVVMVLLAVLLAWLINAGIRRHTYYVHDGIRAMMRGDFSGTIVASTRNEFGELLLALNDMRTEFLRLLSIEAEQRARLQQEVVQRRETEAELRRMVAAIEHAGDPILIEKADGRIVYVNPAFERLMGVQHGAAIGLTARNYSFGADTPQVAAAMHQTLDRGQPWYGRLTSRLPGREPLTLDASVSPIITADGLVSHHVFVLRDVTEQRALEAQLARAQKLEAVGQLAAGIAHEINTPVQYVGDNIHFVRDSFARMDALISRLQTIAAAVPDLEAALHEADLDFLREEVPRALDQSADGCQRIATIVKAMKEFSHPGQDKTPVDLNRAIESTITVATNEWKYIAELVTDFDADLPQVTCMPGEFNQVILNMLVNAAHAIADVVGDGSRDRGTITVSTRHVGGFVEVRISDTGTGIAPTVREKIFDPFFTTKAVGSGTGQGLAIAHDVIVNKHGGTITLDTEIGRGSTFTIRIPVNTSRIMEQPVTCVA